MSNVVNVISASAVGTACNVGSRTFEPLLSSRVMPGLNEADVSPPIVTAPVPVTATRSMRYLSAIVYALTR